MPGAYPDNTHDVFLPANIPGMSSGAGPYMLMPMMAVRVGGAGTTVQVTTVIPHSLQVGEYITLRGFTPPAYNGKCQVSAVIDATHFQVAMKADPGGPATILGCATWTGPAPAKRHASPGGPVQ